MAQRHQRCRHASSSGLISLDFGFTSSAAAVTVPNQCHVNGDGLFYITKFPTQLSVTKTSANPNDANANFEFITPEASHGHTGRTLKYFKTQVMGTLAQDLKDNPILQAIADSTQDLELPRAPGVVAVFLKGLFEQATALLAKKFSGKRMAHLHVVITHPCVWNDEELGQLKLAVEQAGIQGQVCQNCGVTYCPEQEAAVMSAIVHHRTKLQPLYQTGGAIMVVDMGGLTTDPAIYNIRPHERARNVGPKGDIPLGQSSFSSALSADAGFRSKLTQLACEKFDRSEDDEEFKLQIEQDVRRAKEFYEKRIKPVFTGRKSLGENYEFRILNKKVLMRWEHLSDIFEPAISETVEMLCNLYAEAERADNAPKILCLTGGFAQSPRVQLGIQSKLQLRLRENCPELLMPTNDQQGRLTVCHGGIMIKMPWVFN